MSVEIPQAELEERYLSFLLQAPTPICVTRGPGHRIELRNAAFEAAFGGGDSVGKAFREAYGHLDLDYYLQVMDRVYRVGERSTIEEAAVRLRETGPAGREERFFNLTYEALRDRNHTIDGLMFLAVDVTAHVQGRRALEESQRRSRFLAMASAALSESLDYERTLRRVAELAVPLMATWCTVVAVDERGGFRRLAVVHDDPAKADLVAEYQAKFPPSEHRAGQLLDAVRSLRPILSDPVTDQDLSRAAQSDDHLRILRGLGCTSCIMVPMMARGEALGVISLMRVDPHHPYGEPDLTIAAELAHRAALAVDGARLYRHARQREDAMRFLAEASVILSSSLDYRSIGERLANLVVPHFADWCGVDIDRDGTLESLAIAHVNPAKVEFARDLRRRYPPDPKLAVGPYNVVRTGKSELYEDVSDELLARGARDEEHLRISRELGLRSAIVVPLVARGLSIGALSLVWAESGRHYDIDDLAMMEELGRRAGLAVDNARLYEEAQRAVQLRDEFLSIASHELKTPLTTLALQVSGMKRAVTNSQPTDATRIIKRIDVVDKQVLRLTALVDSLLDVSRAEAGRLQLNPQDVDLAQVVREVVERLASEAAAAGCAIEVQFDAANVPPGGQARILGRWDPLRLDEIVTNFLTNAFKYGAGHPITIRVWATPMTAVLEVRDHGIGISLENQARLFKRFARIVSPDHYGGFGLGLWIVKILVEAMGGTVSVESAVDQGSVFCAELPLEGVA
jgi:signal transduction histidine kinase